MSSEMSEVLKLIGLGTPVLYATAAYSFFHFLDEKASDDAKTAIAAWLNPRAYDRKRLSAALLEVFDRIYGRPFFSLRAFARSAFLSIAISTAYMFEFEMLPQMWNFDFHDWASVLLIIPVVFNILTDYISLFFIRKWLTFEWPSPMISLVTGMLLGCIVIVAFFYLQMMVISTIAGQYILGGSLFENLVYEKIYLVNFLDVFMSIFASGGHGDLLSTPALVLPAFAVFLWLPLLAFGMSFVKLTNRVAYAVAKVQWFLANGDEHPLEAVGFVAAFAVFAVTAILQHAPWSVRS